MNRIYKTYLPLGIAAASLLPLSLKAQDTGEVMTTLPADTIYNPDIIYSPMPRTYEIAGIKVTGVPNVEDYVITGYSGLAVGDRIELPGDAITNAVKRFYRQGLYSKVQIKVEKTVGDKAWLEISLRQQPRMSEIRYQGTKGGEKKDIDERLAMVPGQQITPNIVARMKQVIQKYYADKGFKNASVTITQQPDLSNDNQVILDVAVDRHNKVKVHKIYIDGNEVLSDNKIKSAMKKTNEKGNLLNLFKQKKFVDSDYADDKKRIIEKYNELGYRDAIITHDSIARYDDNTIDVFLSVEEGNKYYLNDITWVGNTVYPTDNLQNLLGIYPGDVYNQKLLNKRLELDDDAVHNVYLDQGYLFSSIVPIEQNVKGDSISLQLRVYEGQPAKINRVIINGNDQLYEKVIRRYDCLLLLKDGVEKGGFAYIGHSGDNDGYAFLYGASCGIGRCQAVDLQKQKRDDLYQACAVGKLHVLLREVKFEFEKGSEFDKLIAQLVEFL